MRIRYTVRRIMLVVALVAVAGAGVRWGAAMRSRSKIYEIDASLHDIKGQLAAIWLKHASNDPAHEDAARKAVEWHAKRSDLFKEASARPWRDVPPEEEPKLPSWSDRPSDAERAAYDAARKLLELYAERFPRRRDPDDEPSARPRREAPPAEGRRYD